MNAVFEKARSFIYRNARPLDMARFRYHFEGGSREEVVGVLAYYQNEDGGCGHAIEADCWNPDSTPLHTAGAGEILREIDFDDRDHPFVKGLLKWYTGGAHFDGHHWVIAVESNNDHPHAPWWHTDSQSSCHTDYNGTAQIAGFLLRYAPEGSDAFRLGMRIAAEAIDAFLGSDVEDMHTCACYIRLREYIRKAGLTRLFDYDRLGERLHRTVNRLICTDTSRWGEYVCRPSAFFNSGESEFYPENKEIAEYQCRFIEDTQLPDGSWEITWSWERFPEEWAVSKNWWRSHLIIENLLYLKGFGRL